MKNLKQHITETGAVGIDSFTAPDVDGYDTFNITNPEVLKRVNSFVSSIADREYMLPENAIGQLRNTVTNYNVSATVTVGWTLW